MELLYVLLLSIKIVHLKIDIVALPYPILDFSQKKHSSYQQSLIQNLK